MSFPTDLRYRLEYAGFRLIQAGVSARPLEAASRETGIAWRMIAPRLHRHRRALDNLALAFPDMPLKERERLANDMWENLGRTFAEGFFLKQIMAEERVTYEPMEQLREIARGGPCIVCGLHLGNWELVAYAGKLMGAPFTGVYQRLSNPYVDAATLKLRQPIYEGGLVPKTATAARTLLKKAKDGGYPAFLADLRDDRGALVPFFGAPARSTVFPALLARTTGLPLYAGAAFRRPDVRFVIKGERIPVPETNDREADAIVATAALHKQFEAFIREAPEQWMWAHRKWDEARGGRYSEIFGIIPADQ
jgi:Kdo2-lipid IVA lauroyltransferase/acyltransferase